MIAKPLVELAHAKIAYPPAQQGAMLIHPLTAMICAQLVAVTLSVDVEARKEMTGEQLW